MAQPLPRPTGPFPVAFIDIEHEETDKEGENEQSTASGEGAARDAGHGAVSNILVRIYYPCSLSYYRAFDDETERAPWIPSRAYSPGYGYFLGIPSFMFGPLVRLLYGWVKMWALSGPVPVAGDGGVAAGGNYEPGTSSESGPKPSSERRRLPIVILSHGLGGIRTTYSALATNLASHGMVVCALEHRDGSASMTLQRGVLHTYRACPENVPPLRSPSLQELPPMLKNDARQFAFRHLQLRQRCRELDHLLRLLRRIDDGLPCLNLWADTSDGRAPDGVGLLEGRLDLHAISLLGHSFGGATAMQYACTRSAVGTAAVSPWRAVIALDPWMYAVHPKWLDGKDNAQQPKFPLLVVTMEHFHWPENLTSTQQFVRLHALPMTMEGQVSSPPPTKAPVLYTVVQGSHQQCADIPLVSTWRNRWTVAADSPPSHTVMACLNRMILEFIDTCDIDLCAYCARSDSRRQSTGDAGSAFEGLIKTVALRD